MTGEPSASAKPAESAAERASELVRILKDMRDPFYQHDHYIHQSDATRCKCKVCVDTRCDEAIAVLSAQPAAGPPDASAFDVDGEPRRALIAHGWSPPNEVERCEGADPNCGPVEFHDSEGVPLCRTCWEGLALDAGQVGDQ